MHISARLALVALVGASATACRGKIVSTAALHAAGTADAHFTSTGAPLVLWADTAGKWKGLQNFPVTYDIEVMSGTTSLGHVSCTTADSSERVCGMSSNVGDEHSGDCELKLSCSLPAIPAGDATLHVTGTPGPSATTVTNMSLNIRDK